VTLDKQEGREEVCNGLVHRPPFEYHSG